MPVSSMQMSAPISHGRASRATFATGCCVIPRPSSRTSTMSTEPNRMTSASKWNTLISGPTYVEVLSQPLTWRPSNHWKRGSSMRSQAYSKVAQS